MWILEEAADHWQPSFWQPCPQGSFAMTCMPDHAFVSDNDGIEVLHHLCRG